MLWYCLPAHDECECLSPAEIDGWDWIGQARSDSRTGVAGAEGFGELVVVEVLGRASCGRETQEQDPESYIKRVKTAAERLDARLGWLDKREC